MNLIEIKWVELSDHVLSDRLQMSRALSDHVFISNQPRLGWKMDPSPWKGVLFWCLINNSTNFLRSQSAWGMLQAGWSKSAWVNLEPSLELKILISLSKTLDTYTLSIFFWEMQLLLGKKLCRNSLGKWLHRICDMFWIELYLSQKRFR